MPAAWGQTVGEQPHPVDPRFAVGPPPAHTRTTVFVHGVVLDDSQTAALARRVLLISLLMSLLALISSVLQLLSGLFWTAGIIAAVLVPCCGYFGVTLRRRWLLSCFSLSNYVLAALFLGTFIAVLATLDGDPVGCICDDACRRSHPGLSPSPPHPSRCRNLASSRALWWTGMVFGFAMMFLQVTGGQAGRELAKRPLFAFASAPFPLGKPLMVTVPVAPSAPPMATPGARYTYAAGTSGWRE
jgi:hypothetical protein